MIIVGLVVLVKVIDFFIIVVYMGWFLLVEYVSLKVNNECIIGGGDIILGNVGKLK